MITSRLFLVPAAALLLLSGCSLQEKYAKNEAAGAAWLKESPAPARANFEGIYYTPDWGTVTINQEDGNLTGSLAHYQLRGVVSGKTARLLLTDDYWTDYTMILTRKSFDKLSGAYSEGVPFSKDSSKPIVLHRITQ